MEKANKYSECVHCSKFFECDNKGKVEHCISFEEYKEDRNG